MPTLVPTLMPASPQVMFSMADKRWLIHSMYNIYIHIITYIMNIYIYV